MKPEQTRIVAWMQSQLGRLGWKPDRWAREAKISPTSVTRAMNDEFDSVTSVQTLVALARAAGVPTVLDFLDDQARGGTGSPTAAMLEPLLGRFLPAAGVHDVPSDAIPKVAEAISYTIQLVSRYPNAREDPVVLQIAADAAASRFQPF